MSAEEKESAVEAATPEGAATAEQPEESSPQGNETGTKEESAEESAAEPPAAAAAAKAEEKAEGEEEKSAAPDSETKTGVKTAKTRILVVEDSLPLCRMIEKLLVSAGYEVEIAANGKEGLKCFEAAKEPFSLLIIDIMMPEMDGIQMIAHLRKKALPDLPPIIICSSRSDSETVKLTLKLGAAAYILKPFTTEIVLAKIKAALAQ